MHEPQYCRESELYVISTSAKKCGFHVGFKNASANIRLTHGKT